MKRLTILKTKYFTLEFTREGEYVKVVDGVDFIQTDEEAKEIMISQIWAEEKVSSNRELIRTSKGTMFEKMDYSKVSDIAKVETDDCVVRALAVSLEIPYDEAHKLAKEALNREDGKGTLNTYNNLKNLGTYNGKEFVEFGENCPEVNWIVKGSRDMARTHYYNGKRPIWPYREKGETKYAVYTVGKFLKTFKEGTFYLLVRGHAFCIKDGIVYGNFDDALNLRVPILRVFEVRAIKNN